MHMDVRKECSIMVLILSPNYRVKSGIMSIVLFPANILLNYMHPISST